MPVMPAKAGIPLEVPEAGPPAFAGATEEDDYLKALSALRMTATSIASCSSAPWTTLM